MQVKAVYERYQIMPQLATHMLRVAGVGKLMMKGWKRYVDEELVIRSLLLHDLGNIVKFNLSDEGQRQIKSKDKVDLDYWQKVQKEMWQRYGRDAHEATKKMLGEIGLDELIPIMEEESILYFSEAESVELELASEAAKILMYCDCRVVPSGVVSYRERVDDLVARYGGKSSPTWYEWMMEFEKYMERSTRTNLKTITEEQVKPLFDELLTMDI